MRTSAKMPVAQSCGPGARRLLGRCQSRALGVAGPNGPAVDRMADLKEKPMEYYYRKDLDIPGLEVPQNSPRGSR